VCAAGNQLFDEDPSPQFQEIDVIVHVELPGEVTPLTVTARPLTLGTKSEIVGLPQEGDGTTVNVNWVG
jgi:hypothetical protein